MKIFFYALILLFPFFILGQADTYTVVAENGDGIFSILRKQGLNPAKYYAEFVRLNKENLINGSELHLGREYNIPYAADSFKNTAIAVNTKGLGEESLFSEELASIAPKSSKLKNAVIYLISSNGLSEGLSLVHNKTNQMTINLAKDLMVHGAQVYLIKSKAKDKNTTLKETRNSTTEGAMADFSQIQEYVEIINKKFLKHHGKYQRLLITRVANDIMDRQCKVSVYHHSSSENGRRIASNIQRTFNENSIESKSFKKYTEVFTDKNNLYLAKNALPAITLIDIDSVKKPTVEDIILVDSDRKGLSNLIASGVLSDYADLEIEN